MSGPWRIEGYDTFGARCAPNEIDPEALYPLGDPDGYPSKLAAVKAAVEALREIEREQPSAQSGGQGLMGIQDRVFIVKPDGTKFRVA